MARTREHESDLIHPPNRPGIALGLLLGGSAGAIALSVALSPNGARSGPSAELAEVFSLGAAATCLVMSGVLLLLAWQANEIRLAPLGLGVLYLGAFVFGIADAGSAMLGVDLPKEDFELLRASGSVAAAGLVMLGARYNRPERWGLPLTAMGTLAFVWVAYAAMRAFPMAKLLLAGPAGPGAIAPAALFGIGLLWYLRRWKDRGRGVDLWAGLLCGIMALLGLGATAAESTSSVRFAVLAATGFTGMVVITIGLTGSLQSALITQQRRLDATHRRLASVAQSGTVPVETQEVAHEARSALAALDHAVSALTNGHRVAPREVEDAIRMEIDLLRRLLTPGGRIRHEVFSLSSVLNAAVSASRLLGQEVSVANSSEPISVLGDRIATAEVVQNLLENARVHAPGTSVEVIVTLAGDEVWIEVADRGPGIPVEILGLVFRKGFSTAGTGGYGLYVVRRLVGSQGGSVWASSPPEGGATIGFSLPLAGSPDPGERFEEHRQPVDILDLGGPGVDGSPGTSQDDLEGAAPL